MLNATVIDCTTILNYAIRFEFTPPESVSTPASASTPASVQQLITYGYQVILSKLQKALLTLQHEPSVVKDDCSSIITRAWLQKTIDTYSEYTFKDTEATSTATPEATPEATSTATPEATPIVTKTTYVKGELESYNCKMILLYLDQLQQLALLYNDISSPDRPLTKDLSEPFIIQYLNAIFEIIPLLEQLSQLIIADTSNIYSIFKQNTDANVSLFQQTQTHMTMLRNAYIRLTDDKVDKVDKELSRISRTYKYIVNPQILALEQSSLLHMVRLLFITQLHTLLNNLYTIFPTNNDFITRLSDQKTLNTKINDNITMLLTKCYDLYHDSKFIKVHYIFTQPISQLTSVHDILQLSTQIVFSDTLPENFSIVFSIIKPVIDKIILCKICKIIQYILQYIGDTLFVDSTDLLSKARNTTQELADRRQPPRLQC